MRAELQWNTDSNGMVVGPVTHDGTLVAVSYSGGSGSLRLRVKTITNGLVEIELTELDRVGIINFRNGAIFSEAFVWKLGDLSAQNLDAMHSEVLALFGNDLDVITARKELAKIKQANPGLLLVYVGCSYGGEIAALCRRLQIYEVFRAEDEGVTP